MGHRGPQQLWDDRLSLPFLTLTSFSFVISSLKIVDVSVPCCSFLSVIPYAQSTYLVDAVDSHRFKNYRFKRLNVCLSDTKMCVEATEEAVF